MSVAVFMAVVAGGLALLSMFISVRKFEALAFAVILLALIHILPL